MKSICFPLFAVIACLILAACTNKRSGIPRILVFSKTTGFRHSSIPDGRLAIMKLGSENGFAVDTTENAAYFHEDSLKKYSAVVFLNTTDNTDQLLDHNQENAFERYIQAGGGFVGVHAATDAEYQWGWYVRLVGASFESHPEQQQATLNVVNKEHPSTNHLPDQWTRKDEWYNFKNINKDVKVLIRIDEKSYNGGKNGDNHPMAWYHDYDGGRAFYTELGHTEESYKEENYLKHLLGGIQYAIGDNKELNYSKAKALRIPDEDRFTKTPLKQGMFYEPTEMTILPNFDILIAQRRGEILLYKSEDSSLKQVGFLPVYFKTNTPNVNAEEGLLGIQADPDFAKNHYVYLFYSPADTSVNRLSRFTFENDTLNASTEKVVLQFYSQRNICCHTGGSIAFGKDRQLYVSTGDNSTPFNEPGQKFVSHGYAPLDDRPGHEQFDARRSAGNTNDLRGKILRIRVNEDGSYSIPEGNLFPKGQKDARPEIYVMGNRNPYRISVDKRNGFLYWGEVGPDANNDSLDSRGPRGYDELNQARKAGFFGWPLFVGKNYAYKEYDYGTGKSGNNFTAEKPVNNSRNNTGLSALPPVSPSFIWYPYAVSADFPQVGNGGRNAMAGPAYYTDDYPAKTRLPDYYNNKVFIYDWIRGWIKAVTLLPNGDFDKMEPFMPSTKLSSLIDMETGPDGKLYMLEYGSGWFTKNPDAALSRIDFNSGNRAPKITALHVDKTSGALPFTVKARVESKDPEGKKLSYTWDLGNGVTKTTDVPELTYTFDKAGDYALSVMVSDDEKASAKSKQETIYAGNETPHVRVDIAGNKTFYFPGSMVNYNVVVSDKDDTSRIDPANLIVSAEYMEGSDKAALSQGHQVMTESMMGKNLMLSSDCKTCHQTDQKSIGPSYADVAKKYSPDKNAMAYLSDKIIQGGSGVWGETAMPAHPGINKPDAHKIVSWILSLSGSAEAKKSLPVSGSLKSTLGQPIRPDGVLYVSASYTDKGRPSIKPLTGHAMTVLRNNRVNFSSVSHVKDYSSFDIDGMHLMIVPQGTGSFSMDSIDLTGIKMAELKILSETGKGAYRFEIRLDGPDGKKLGGGLYKGSGKIRTEEGLRITLEPVTDGKFHDLYIVSSMEAGQEQGTAALSALVFHADAQNNSSVSSSTK